MKLFFYLLNILAIAVTITLGLEKGLFVLAFFASSPYVMSFFLLKIAKDTSARVTAKVLTVFMVSVGLYFLLDTTYMERNLGYKFSYLFIPIWQWTMLFVAGAVVYLSNPPKSDA